MMMSLAYPTFGTSEMQPAVVMRPMRLRAPSPNHNVPSGAGAMLVGIVDGPGIRNSVRTGPAPPAPPEDGSDGQPPAPPAPVVPPVPPVPPALPGSPVSTCPIGLSMPAISQRPSGRCTDA